MIQYFSVSNFKSLKDPCILELDTNVSDHSGVAQRTVGITGANASGKTTVLQAITFLFWFMHHSFLQVEEGGDIPVDPHVSLQEKPTEFFVIFSVPKDKFPKDMQEEGFMKYVEFEYELKLTKKSVISECLRYAPKRKGSWRNVYKRSGREVTVGNKVNELDENDLRENCSVISYAAQYNSHRIAKICKNLTFRSNLGYAGYRDIDVNEAILDDLLRTKKSLLLHFLRMADVGIEDLRIVKPDEEERQEILKFLTEQKADEKVDGKIQIPQDMVGEVIKALRGEDDAIMIGRALFSHRVDGKLSDFPLEMESSGTQRFIALLGMIVEALDNGGLVVVDEIDIKLHHALLAFIVGLFDGERNDKDAQIIFSFHNTAIIDVLTPEQLWFTEKNDDGRTELFSAIDFEDLNYETYDLEMLYRIGRFGAKPRSL